MEWFLVKFEIKGRNWTFQPDLCNEKEIDWFLSLILASGTSVITYSGIPEIVVYGA